ncbi:MAG: hypothetical protein GYB67_04885 [Chloroflexi bacterium]|nr:hypothetical protein [Chloroflexota bacterium]
MTAFDPPDCQIYADADIAEQEVFGLLAETLFSAAAVDAPGEAALADNPDYDSNRRKRFPDGFIYFRYRIDIYSDDQPVAVKAGYVGRLLESFWEQGFPAVAVCAYEDRLPERGGYQSQTIPWPR